MNKFLLLIVYFLVSYVNAQVGINTLFPSRTLHVDGDVRIRDLEDKSKDLSYTKVLVTDNNGNVDYITDQSLLPQRDEFTSNKEVFNSIYGSESGGPNNDKFVTCGKFDFKFTSTGGTNSSVQLRLKQTPAEDFKMFISIEQSWDNGMEFIAYNTPMAFTKGKSDFIDIPYGPGIVDFELNVLYLIYPNDTDLYRVTIYRVKQALLGDNYRDYTIACEKF